MTTEEVYDFLSALCYVVALLIATYVAYDFGRGLGYETASTVKIEASIVDPPAAARLDSLIAVGSPFDFNCYVEKKETHATGE